MAHMHCPVREYCDVSFLVCIILCPNSTKRKCKEYAEHYEELKAFTVEPRYVEKYGKGDLPAPIKKREFKKDQPKIIKAKVQEEVTKLTSEPEPKKRKRRTKEEIQKAKQAEENRGSSTIVEEAKPKRVRRTKAQIEADKAKGGK